MPVKERTTAASAAIDKYEADTIAADERQASVFRAAAATYDAAVVKADAALEKARRVREEAVERAARARRESEGAAMTANGAAREAARAKLHEGAGGVLFVQERGTWRVRIAHSPGAPVFGTAQPAGPNEWMASWGTGVAHVGSEATALRVLYAEFDKEYPTYG